MARESRALSLMALDRAGVVSAVVQSVAKRDWGLGRIWAQSHCGMFFLMVEVLAPRDPATEREFESLKGSLRTELAAEVLVGDVFVDDPPASDSHPEYLADITIEGGRVFHLLAEATSVMAHESATITSISTDVSKDQTRYIIRATYDSVTRDSLRAALRDLSNRDGFQFEATP